MGTVRKRWATLCIVLTLIATGAPGFCDFIRMKDGTVLLGRVTAADATGITLETIDASLHVPASLVLRTETEVEEIQHETFEVSLKDGSLIRGRIGDYDKDVGLLVDMDFGQLTIPVESLKGIKDPVQRARYNGSSLIAGASGGYEWPVGTLSSSFSPDWACSAWVEIGLPFMRGLFAGIQGAWLPLDFTTAENLDYNAALLTGGLSYRLLALHDSTIPVLKNIVPWAGAGAGAAYVTAHDGATGADPVDYGEIDPALYAALGVDVVLADHFIIRMSGSWLAVLQSSSILHMPSASLSAACSF